MSNQHNLLSYTLSSNLAKTSTSVRANRYSAQLKGNGTFGDAELQEAMATASRSTVAFIRYLEDLRRSIIEQALRDGKRVFVNGIAVMGALRGTFSAVDDTFDPAKHKLTVASFAYGDLKDCLADIVPENTVKGGSPSLSRINEAGQENEVIAGKDELTITGRDLAPDVAAADEGVFLVSPKTGERVATATVSSSNLVEVVCQFETLPPAGRYRLVVATRGGFGAEYKVAEASREVEVR